MARNYKKEYKNYHSKDDQKKRRASRNKVRRAALRKGKVTKGDKKDIDHKDGNPKNNKKSNLRVVSRSKNRSFPRNKKAGKKIVRRKK
jgi:hypothetical protein